MYNESIVSTSFILPLAGYKLFLFFYSFYFLEHSRLRVISWWEKFSHPFFLFPFVSSSTSYSFCHVFNFSKIFLPHVRSHLDFKDFSYYQSDLYVYDVECVLRIDFIRARDGPNFPSKFEL